MTIKDEIPEGEEENASYKEMWRGAWEEGGYNPDDLFREIGVPFLAVGMVSASGLNLVFQVARFYAGDINSQECQSVNTTTVVSNNNDIGTRCIADIDGLVKIVEHASEVRDRVVKELIYNCYLEALIVDAKKGRVAGVETQLTARHWLQRPDNNWTVVIDGYAKLDAPIEEFQAGEYTSFLQPSDENSLECARSVLEYERKTPFDGTGEIICNLHFDPIMTYNGTGLGESIMPVVGCGSVKVPNPSELEGERQPDIQHYNHIPTRNRI